MNSSNISGRKIAKFLKCGITTVEIPNLAAQVCIFISMDMFDSTFPDTNCRPHSLDTDKWYKKVMKEKLDVGKLDVDADVLRC